MVVLLVVDMKVVRIWPPAKFPQQLEDQGLVHFILYSILCPDIISVSLMMRFVCHTYVGRMEIFLFHWVVLVLYRAGES